MNSWFSNPIIFVRGSNGKKTLWRINSRSRRKILSRLKSDAVEKFYLKVTYAPGIINDGEYSNKHDLLFALRCFTDKDEIEWLRNYWSEGTT